MTAGLALISEEGHFSESSFLDDCYWLIDPIDGTSNFAKNGKGYTVNIALIKEGIPILGIIGYPPTRTIWYGYKNKASIIKNKQEKKY